MAAPSEKTLQDLNGSWTMNKKDSGDTDAILALQRVGWFLRRAIGIASITLQINQYKDETDVEHIDINQILSPGLQGTREERVLNWKWRDHRDFVFGQVRGRTRRVALCDLPDDEDGTFLKQDWDESVLNSGEVIETFVENLESGWTASQTWGFEVKDGVRKHARHVVVRDVLGKNALRVKIYYDYNGSVPTE